MPVEKVLMRSEVLELGRGKARLHCWSCEYMKGVFVDLYLCQPAASCEQGQRKGSLL